MMYKPCRSSIEKFPSSVGLWEAAENKRKKRLSSIQTSKCATFSNAGQNLSNNYYSFCSTIHSSIMIYKIAIIIVLVLRNT